MDNILKQRMVGAVVLVSLGVIFIPMLLSGKGELAENDKSNIPPLPKYEIKAPKKPATIELKIPPKDSPKSQASGSVNNVSEPEPSQTISKQSHKSAPVTSKTPANKPVNTESAKSDSSSTPNASKSSQVSDKPAVKQAANKPVAAAMNATQEKPKSSLKVGWVVQVGSFEKRENANKLRDKLRINGFAAFVEPRKGETMVYRVRVGPEATRVLAEKLQRSLLNKLKLKGIVLKYP